MNTKETIAYCWANGRIEFGKSVPEGAIPIATGTNRQLRKLIAVTARLAYDHKTLLVPGVPEASNQNDACDALVHYKCYLMGRECDGFRVVVEHP